MRKWWVVLVIALSFSTLLVPWMVFESELEFTSGKPAGSRIILESTIDSETQYNDLEFEKATPFIFWMLQREEVVNASDSPEVAQKDVNPSRLDNSRMLMHFIVLLQITSCLILFSGLSNKRRYALAIWLVGLLTLTLLIPWAWMADSAEIMSGGTTWQGQGFEKEESFAHTYFEHEFSWSITGVELSHSGSGWDLGMVDETNRTLISNGPPENHPSQEDALISWNGAIGLSFGIAHLLWLLSIIPLVFGNSVSHLINKQDATKYHENKNDFDFTDDSIFGGSSSITADE